MNNFIALYQKQLELQDCKFLLINHADATVAIVYSIIKPTGEHFILKICTRPNDYIHEVYFLNYLSTVLPVPRIIKVVEPETNLNGAILMECLPGTLLKKEDLTESLAYEIGSALARIHSNRAPLYGDFIHQKDGKLDPRPFFTLKFEEGLAECANNIPTILLQQCKDYFYKHLSSLDLIDGPCLVHRDFRSGNIMVNNGKLQGIIDWSSARASFAQEDFCTLEHEELLTNPILKKSFLAGYAAVRSVPNYDEMMPLLRLSRAIAVIGFTVKRGTWNNKNADVYQFNRHFLESFF